MTAIILVLSLTLHADYARPALLMEPAELSKAEGARKPVVLDARAHKDYLAGHIPGAVWVDVAAWSKAINAGQEESAWSTRIGRLGIDTDTPVVVYGDVKRPEAARVWWILRYWGVKEVRLLNGGWNGWRAIGGERAITEPAPTPRQPELKRDPRRLAGKADLLRELSDGSVGQLIDSRSHGEHCGETKTAKRNGAIPGAKHLDWSDTLDAKTGRFRSAAELAKLFRDAGIDLDKPATTYCQSGGRAAVMAFVVELMSGKPARNYYRSWSEWGNDTKTPIVTPKK